MPKWVVHCKKDRYDIFIGRPTIWGNPYSHKAGTTAKFLVKSREEAIARFEDWLISKPGLVALVKQELRGKVLGCWCSPKTCHGDVLARIANG